MVTPIRTVKAIVFQDAAKQRLRESFCADSDSSRKTVFVEDGSNKPTVVKVSPKVLNEVDHVMEDQGRYAGFSDHQENIGEAVNSIRDFFKRASGRTTGMFSRVLRAIFNWYGFKDTPVDSRIKTSLEQVEEEMSSSQFIAGFSDYYKIADNDGKKVADKKLVSIFEGDKAKQNLAGITYRVMNIFNKIKPAVLTYFPMVFCFHNVLTPFFAKLDGFVGKTFKFFRIINPFFDEFLSSIMGVFKTEIEKTQGNLAKAKANEGKIVPKEINGIENEKGELIDTIHLSSLTKEQYELKSTLDNVNKALERMIGKNNNISSLVVGFILKQKGFDDYKQVANETVNNPEFIKKLYGCLKDAKSEGKSPYEKITERFNGSEELVKQGQVAKVLLATTSLANNLSEDMINKWPSKFGNVYSWQYLAMPIISTIIGNKGFFGKLINFIADVNPFVNDFFLDPIATFQEEIKGIREKSSEIKELFPQLGTLGLSGSLSLVRNTWNSIIGSISGLSKRISGTVVSRFAGS